MRVNRLVAVLAILLSSSPLCHGSSSQRTISSVAPIWKDSMMQRIGAKVLGESALIDKETGRVFWEGGSQTSVAASIAPIISDLGLHRLKSTLLSIALFACLLSVFARRLRIILSITAQPITWSTAVFMRIASWTVLMLPAFDSWFVVAVIALYFLEAYNCNTRRYLANAIASPDEVEEYIERLRNEHPVVTWKVRCYHYERRIWASTLLPHIVLRKLFRQVDSDSRNNSASAVSVPSLLMRKVVKHVAEANYVYKRCIDNTIAGVWKRASALTVPPPFTKIILTKLIILGNDKARQDYFQQQATFVTTEGQSDELAEFSTNISLQGFKPQLLAVRNVEGVLSTRLFRLHMFWIFTMLGMTLPFRIWFSRHCDELRVTVAKETLADSQSPSPKGWFSKSAITQETNDDPDFRQSMQTLSLYDTPASQAGNVTANQILPDRLQLPDAIQAASNKRWFSWIPSSNIQSQVRNEVPQQTLQAENPQDPSHVEDQETILLEEEIEAAKETLKLLDINQDDITLDNGINLDDR